MSYYKPDNKVENPLAYKGYDEDPFECDEYDEEEEELDEDMEARLDREFRELIMEQFNKRIFGGEDDDNDDND